MTVTYEKLPYASELVPVTPWLPDNSDEDHVTLRRIFTREREDGSYIVLELFACVNEERVYSSLSQTEPDTACVSHDVSLHTSDGDMWSYVMVDAHASEFAGRPITDESLAAWLNQALEPWVPLALEDSITEEIVRKARSVSDYNADREVHSFKTNEECESVYLNDDEDVAEDEG